MSGRSRSTSRPASHQKTRFHTNIASSIIPSVEVTEKIPTIPNMTLNSQNSTPYSHYPLPAEPSGLYNTLITESDMALTKKKFVKISSMGEIEIQPDKVEFCIQISSSKLDIAQCKESIKKREDYIISTLKKVRVRDEDVISSSIVRKCPPPQQEEIEEYLDAEELEARIMKRKNGSSTQKNKGIAVGGTQDKPNDQKGTAGEHLKFVKELCVNCDSLMKYTQILSICNEKLDRHVVVSQPIVRFSPEYMQSSTQSVLRLAMNNGIQKANELISPMKHRVKLGRLYYTVEESLTVTDVEDYNKGIPSKFETFSWKRLNKVLKCCLISVFELDHPKIRKMY